jgi:hypothetical protein
MESKGLAKALVMTSAEVFRGAAPITKVDTPGYLQYLLGNNKPDVISTAKDDGSGYMRNVEIRYRQRGVKGKSVTVDDCSVQVQPAYKTLVVPATSFRALGFAFEDDLIAQFYQDALSPTRMGQTVVMKEVYETIIHWANGLFGDINDDLLAYQAANFGKNVVTGNNTASAVNFILAATTNPLNQGMTKVMADGRKNLINTQNACIIGSGLIDNYYIQHVAGAKSTDQSGVNTSQLALPKYYYDEGTETAFGGANRFALIEKDAVQFVNKCRFRGIKAGQKGSDYFFTMTLPITDTLGQGSMSGFEFDVQLTYRTCPGTETIGGVSVQLGRGWNVILSCAYQTVFIPNDAYAPTDRLNGVNGTLLYTATNV